MTKRMPFSQLTLIAVICVTMLGGCETMSRTGENMLTGGVIGAGAGAAVTALTGGCIPCGAAIGGGAGLGGGYVYTRLTRRPGRS